jgi:hypothetical protein
MLRQCHRFRYPPNTLDFDTITIVSTDANLCANTIFLIKKLCLFEKKAISILNLAEYNNMVKIYYKRNGNV